ncbi:hypothetical protein OIE71_32470 [Streptomyces sp. NBC_01725]|uniref:hypothetical protein n=1 Tax=Streptomyces sp. NBC_01725 TaxID=2975923 RepID=UPI002E292C06|nr:hypothetical protein [Streptomyces sp. NBC_01725]
MVPNEKSGVGQLVRNKAGQMLLVLPDGTFLEVEAVSATGAGFPAAVQTGGTGASMTFRGRVSPGAKRVMTMAAFAAFAALTGDFSAVGDHFDGSTEA